MTGAIKPTGFAASLIGISASVIAVSASRFRTLVLPQAVGASTERRSTHPTQEELECPFLFRELPPLVQTIWNPKVDSDS